MATIAHLIRRKGTALLIGATCLGLVLMGFSQAPAMRVALPLLVLVGFCNTFYLMQVSTYLQQEVPDQLRGRVMSLYSLCWNLLPLGGLHRGRPRGGGERPVRRPVRRWRGGRECGLAPHVAAVAPDRLMPEHGSTGDARWRSR